MGNDALDCVNRRAADACYYIVGRMNSARDALNDCGWHSESNVDWSIGLGLGGRHAWRVRRGYRTERIRSRSHVQLVGAR